MRILFDKSAPYGIARYLEGQVACAPHTPAILAAVNPSGAAVTSKSISLCPQEAFTMVDGGVLPMAELDWSQCPAVESVPGKVSGAWVLRGTRTPVKVLFENLEAGMSIEEVIEQFPVTREEINRLMAFVARTLDKEPSYG